MATTADDEPKRKKRKGAQAMTWVMTGMLVIGLAGFSASNFSNTVSSIGSVGEQTISTNDYARALRQQTQNLSQQFGTPISVQDAISIGLDRQALSSVVTQAALDNLARRVGVSVGDQTVAGEIMKQGAFGGAGGAFSAELYRSTLRQSGWTEAEYEETLRRDVSRMLIQSAVQGGAVAPASVTKALHAYIAERRGFTLLRLSEADLASPIAEPDEATLKAHHEANIAIFTKPAARRIRYAALLPADLAAAQEVDEAKVRALYDEHIDQYVVPERRMIDRLVYPDAAARDAALAQAQGGKAFEDLVSDRGLDMMAVDMGDVSRADLGAAADAVFGAEPDAVVAGETDLGPALFRINGVLEAQETSFDAVKDELSGELRMEAAAAEIAARIDEIDDLLAGGATVDELARDAGMTIGTVDHVPGRPGLSPIEASPAFRKAADAVAAGDFAEAIVLEDGGVVTVEFVEDVPAAPIPFEEAREAVSTHWQAEALQKALTARAEEIRAAVAAGTDMASLGKVEVTEEVSRDAQPDTVPASLMERVFALEPGAIEIIDQPGLVGVLRLDHVTAADDTSAESDALKAAVAAQIEQAQSQDMLRAFTDAVSAEAGITLDQSAINLVHTSLQ